MEVNGNIGDMFTSWNDTVKNIDTTIVKIATKKNIKLKKKFSIMDCYKFQLANESEELRLCDNS